MATPPSPAPRGCSSIRSRPRPSIGITEVKRLLLLSRPEAFAPPRIVVGTDAEPVTTLTWQDWQAEGEGWGTRGKWLLDVPQATDFRVTAILKQPHAGTARLMVSGKSVEQTVDEKADRIVFDRVTLLAGDGELGFLLETPGGMVDPYHVVLEWIEQ